MKTTASCFSLTGSRHHSAAGTSLAAATLCAVTVLTVALLPAHGYAAKPLKELTAKQIMQSMIDRDEGTTREQTITMQLIASSGHTRTRQAHAVSKKYGDTTKSRIRFLAPASLKNTAMLTIDEKDTVIDDQWVYIPGLNTIRKIAAGDQKSSFFGTDLIYADLTRRRIEDYSYKRLADKNYKGVLHYQVEATPNAAEQDVTGYKKMVVLVHPTSWLPTKTLAHLVDGSHKITEINATDTIKSYVTPTRMTVGRIKSGGLAHKSVFEYGDIRINEPVDDAVFTQDALRK